MANSTLGEAREDNDVQRKFATFLLDGESASALSNMPKLYGKFYIRLFSHDFDALKCEFNREILFFIV